MSERYLYDAFISYRHLSPDQETAMMIQSLLERYVPPKAVGGRIKRIFLDRTELPTSNDLDQSLQDALMGSRYLIAVISEKTRESKWCMEEIRRFKEAHDGRIDHILPVLVQGEPGNALPQELRWEIVPQTFPDGRQAKVLKEVEPLCCDARAENDRERKKTLKREFLRLAAPILGCGFDDLYQRHERRRRRRLAAFLTAGFAALAAVLLVVSFFAVRASRARDQYQANLVDTYLRQGAQKNAEGDRQQALMYYSEALALDPDNETAISGALLTMQGTKWLNCETLVRAEAEDDPASGSAIGQNAYYYGGLYSPPVDLSAYGERLRSYEDAPLALWGDDQYLTLYDGETGSVYRVNRPTAENPKLTEDPDGTYDPTPLAYVFGEDRLVVKYGGYLYLYQVSSWEETGEAGTLTDTLDLATVFTDDYSLRNGLDIENQIWVDRETGLAVVQNSYSLAVMNLSEAGLYEIITQYQSFIIGAAFRADGNGFALLYGNQYGQSYMNTGGFVEIYNKSGKLLASTGIDSSFVPKRAVFSPEGETLLVYNADSLRLYNASSGELYCTPLYQDGIASAAFTENGTIRVTNRYGSEYLYRIAEYRAPYPAEYPALEVPSPQEEVYDLGNGLSFVPFGSQLTVKATDGSVRSEQNSLLLFNRVTLHPKKQYIYLWQNGREDLCRIALDPETGIMGTPELLSTEGHACGNLCCFDEYLALVTIDHRILVYSHTGTKAFFSCIAGEEGDLKRVCCDGKCHLAIHSVKTFFSDPSSISYDTQHSIQLWDISQGLLLNTVEGSYFNDLAFHENGTLTYKDLNGNAYVLLASVEASSELRELISGLSCYKLGDSQELVLKTPMLGEASVDAVSALFPSSEKESGKSARIDLKVLNKLLEEQETDAWFAACDKIWNTVDLSLDEMADFFSYCRENAPKDDYGKLRIGYNTFSAALESDDDDTGTAAMIMSRETENIMIYTTALDEDIAAFFSNMADKYTQLLKGDLGIFDQYYYFALEADYRFEQLILQKTWPGTEAFRAMLSGDPYGILWESDFNSGTAALAALADGDGETAGRLASHAANYLYDAMSDTLSGTTLDMEATAFLQYAWIFTRHGDIITEEKLQACLQNLSFSIGVELKPIRWKDLNAGLRLGDYIMEANGKRFACGLHARLLLQDLKTAKMTVYRDDKTIQTKEMDTPYVAYYYHIFK